MRPVSSVFRGKDLLKKQELCATLKEMRIQGGTVLQIRKLLIADESETLTAALTDAFRGSCQVRVCTDGDSAKKLLSRFRPDVLVLDLMLPGYDGLSLLQWAADQGIFPLVLATSRFCSDYVVERAQVLGVRYLMRKPCGINGLIRQVTELLRYEPSADTPCRERNGDTRTVLLALRIPGKRRGFTYLCHAVPLFARDPLQSVTKVLYPEVAKRCGSEPSHVERSIRSAIEAGWKHRDGDIWKLYFPESEIPGSRRPSNGEFIARLAQVLEQSGTETGQVPEIVQNVPKNRKNVRE